jgi:hypothetical protein
MTDHADRGREGYPYLKWLHKEHFFLPSHFRKDKQVKYLQKDICMNRTCRIILGFAKIFS